MWDVFQEETEPQQLEDSGPYEEIYKDSSTFLKVGLIRFFVPRFVSRRSHLVTDSFPVPARSHVIYSMLSNVRSNPYPLLHRLGDPESEPS